MGRLRKPTSETDAPCSQADDQDPPEAQDYQSASAEPEVPETPRRQRSATQDIPEGPLPKVILDCSLCQLEFEVYGVSVGEHFIALDLPPSAPLFSPKNMLDLTIIYEGKHYEALYVGGQFDFPWRNVKALAFLRKNDDDKERKS